jgi:hypothetical protein
MAIVSSQPNAFAGGMGMGGMGGMSGGARPATGSTIQPPSSSMSSTDTSTAEAPKDIREARLTILRAVAEKHISPDEAEKLLFGEG